MKAKIRIAELARQHNFKNAYALQNALKCSPTMASRLWSGEFKQIGIETMEKLCDLFKCSYNDLFGYDVAPVKADKLPEQKPLNSFEIVREKKKRLGLREKDAKLLAEQLSEGNSGKPFNYSILETVKNSSDNEYVLTTAAAGELLNLSPRSVRENAEKGLLPGKQGKQNHWFFRRSDIDGFILRRG
jgi:DNA-binding Xre family transcriptional regulator